MQEQETRKKILILAVAIALFGTSYYYYVHKKEKASEPEQKQVIQTKEKPPVEKKKPEELKPSQEDKKEEKNSGNKDKKVKKPGLSEAFMQKIRPSNKAELIELAFNSAGKRDPFSYRESKFRPAGTGPSRKGFSAGDDGLPAPPSVDEKPRNYAEIKGFFGNKVIADINGITDSLAAGESFGGIKVLSVDQENLTCEFMINGKKVIKKMKPVNKPDKNVEIKYLFDEPTGSLGLIE